VLVHLRRSGQQLHNYPAHQLNEITVADLDSRSWQQEFEFFRIPSYLEYSREASFIVTQDLVEKP
jgi:hypothetical protein